MGISAMANRPGVCHQVEVTGKPWLALAPTLLFPMAGIARPQIMQATPIAALVENPNEGRLIFADKVFNGGVEWRESVQGFLACIDVSLAAEAVRLIKAYELPETFEEASPIVIVEHVVDRECGPRRDVSNVIRSSNIIR